MESVLGKITLIQIADLGKIRFMSMKLDEKDNLVRFVGPNEAGKSTILDNLQSLFQSSSNIPNGIIRNGFYSEGVRAGTPIDKGMARIETSNGYVIERVIRKNKEGAQTAELKVLHNNIPVQGGPLGFLKSVSTKYPDPHKISNLSEKELYEELASLINFDFKRFDDKITAIKEDSKTARVLLKNLGAKIEQPLSIKPEVLPEKSLVELFRIAEPMRVQFDIKVAEYKNNLRTWEEAVKSIEDYKNKIIMLESQMDSMTASGFNPDTPPVDPDLMNIENEIRELSKNSEVIKEWNNFENDYVKRKEYSERIFKNDQDVLMTEAKKWEEFAATAENFLPKNTVRLDSSGVLRAADNLPWDTLSHAARLTLAAHLCMATIPSQALRAVYIERGESIGSDKMKIIARIAKEYDVQVFMEVFSENGMTGDGVILLEEGEVVFPGNEAPIEVNFPPERPVAPELNREVNNEIPKEEKKEEQFASYDPGLDLF